MKLRGSRNCCCPAHVHRRFVRTHRLQSQVTFCPEGREVYSHTHLPDRTVSRPTRPQHEYDCKRNLKKLSLHAKVRTCNDNVRIGGGIPPHTLNLGTSRCQDRPATSPWTAGRVRLELGMDTWRGRKIASMRGIERRSVHEKTQYWTLRKFFSLLFISHQIVGLYNL